MTVAYNDGINRVNTQVPELWKYYKNTFLPMLNQHIRSLNNKMLSGWSPELFSSSINHGGGFHFEVENQIANRIHP
jgi:hypothetical protein